MKRSGQWYKGFSPDTTDEEARAAFTRQFGHAPEEIIRTKGAVLAGPIPAGSPRDPSANPRAG